MVKQGTPASISASPDKRTALQRWKLLKAVWRASRAFIGNPTPEILIKRAYHHWNINDQTTSLTSTLSIGGYFSLYETRLLSSVMSMNKLTILRVGGIQFSQQMLFVFLKSLSISLKTLKALYLPNIGLGCEGAKKLWNIFSQNKTNLKNKLNNKKNKKSQQQQQQQNKLFNLEILDLRNNSIESSGLDGLDDALLSLPCLCSLDLSSNKLSDEGIINISFMIKNISNMYVNNIEKEEQEEQEHGVDMSHVEVEAVNTSQIEEGVLNKDIKTQVINADNYAETTAVDEVKETSGESIGGLPALPLQELRLTNNCFGIQGLSELLSILTECSVFPELHRCDVSSNPFPARPASYAVRSMLEARRKHRMKNNPASASILPKTVEAGQLDDDGTPKRFIPGLKIRATNPKQSVRLRENELTMVLQGGFEISESEAVGLIASKPNTMLASDIAQPRSLYFRNRQSLPSPRQPNHAPDQYPLIATRRRNPLTPQQSSPSSVSRTSFSSLSLIESGGGKNVDSRTIRRELDRIPTLEMTAGKAHSIEKPLPPQLIPAPSLLGSASRPLGGHRPRKFHPLTLHDEKAVLRSEYTNLTKALVLPDFVSDFRSRSSVQQGL